MSDCASTSVRRVEPLARDWRSFQWPGGRFDTAQRPLTERVEGTIRIPQYLVLATLRGAAQELTVEADCGHRYRGAEHTGAISIVIPDCERRLQLRGVRAKWASLAIDRGTFARCIENMPSPARGALGSACLTNLHDPFLFALLSEMESLNAQDGGLDESYCEAMSLAAVQHLHRRYFVAGRSAAKRDYGLPRWQLRKVEEYVEDNLERPIRIADLAALAGCSDGHFHRAFRRAYGSTPLELINQRRIRRAIAVLQREPRISVAELAERVGYTSPSYFARLFRRYVGVHPAGYRFE